MTLPPLPQDLKQGDNFDSTGRRNPTYPNPPFQGGDDLSHHPHQVLVLVCVVREPHGLADGQDLPTDEPGMWGWGHSPELTSQGRGVAGLRRVQGSRRPRGREDAMALGSGEERRRHNGSSCLQLRRSLKKGIVGRC